jgi:hypothetical protein
VVQSLRVLKALRPSSISQRKTKQARRRNMNIFTKKPNPREVLRESKREMTQATRGIEKEIGSLQSEV